MTSPYNPSPYGGYPQAEHPQGTTILILGALSVAVCAPIGIAAWIMGNTALKEIDAKPGFYSNRSTVSAGRICGIIGTAITGLTVLGVLIVIMVGVASS